MELNLRKLWSVLGVACLSINLSAAAGTTQATGTQQSIKPVLGTCSDATCYAGPLLHQDSAGIIIGAEYLLWSMRQEGLEYIASNYSTTTSQTEQGYVSGPRFNLHSGFRVMAGVTIAESDNVDINVSYTWLARTTSNNNQTGLQNTYATINTDPVGSNGAPVQVASATGTWKADYNLFDLEIGRLSTFAKDSLNLRPFWGLRGTWQTQEYNVIYSQFANNADLATYFAKQKTGGVGVRTGFNYIWNLFANEGYKGGFAIVGTSSIAGVYGSTSILQQSTETTSGNTAFYTNVKDSMQRIIPVIDLSLGLSWNVMFGGDADDEYALEFHAKWDTQSWIGMGKQFAGTLNDRGSQNLTLQGLTVGLGFWF